MPLFRDNFAGTRARMFIWRMHVWGLQAPRAMPDDKSIGKRILGLFVESGDAAASPSDEPSTGAASPADEIAALARNSAPVAAEPVAVAAPARVAVTAPGTVPTNVEPAKIDFDVVFKNAGIDPQALDRVRKAEELLKTLPDSAGEEVKRQIVEASLKAFGFEISRIVEGVETQLKALDTYVRINEQQTSKALTDSQAQIAKLEDQVISLKAEMNKRTAGLASLAAAADVRRRQVDKVLTFFKAPAATASKTNE